MYNLPRFFCEVFPLLPVGQRKVTAASMASVLKDALFTHKVVYLYFQHVQCLI